MSTFFRLSLPLDFCHAAALSFLVMSMIFIVFYLCTDNAIKAMLLLIATRFKFDIGNSFVNTE